MLRFRFQRDLEFTLQFQADAFLNVEEQALSIKLNLLFSRSTSEGEGFPSSETDCASPAYIKGTVKKQQPKTPRITILDFTRSKRCSSLEGGTVTLVRCL